MSHLSVDQKKKIYSSFGGNEANTGSIEAQIAQMTERINHISRHLQQNKKDFSTHRGLMQLVGRRKRFLQYMHRTNITVYRQLLEKLGLRK
jgi:small subunit ribosomal protein S15